MTQQNGPRCGVRFGIVDGHLNLQLAEVRAPKPFRYFRGFGDGSAFFVRPRAISQTDGLNHQRVAVPLRRRVTFEGRLRVGGEWSSVREDLPVHKALLVKDYEQSRNLDELPRASVRMVHERTHGKTLSVGAVFAV